MGFSPDFFFQLESLLSDAPSVISPVPWSLNLSFGHLLPPGPYLQEEARISVVTSYHNQ